MKIYVACPGDTVTGGVELLHQLCHELNKYSWIKAKMWYPYAAWHEENPQPREYDEYKNEWISSREPEEDAVLIFPEIWADLVNGLCYKNHKKIIYWESVDNYFLHTSKPVTQFPDGIIHLTQSNYAYDFLRSKCNIPAHNIIFVTDYVNASYLAADAKTERKTQVVYNPAKGLEFTQKVMEAMPDVKFVPIKDMARWQVKDLLSESALYVDFGNHPGKDRIPREACICGCCVITSRNGSANYDEDVPINDCYKVDISKDGAVDQCVRIIRDVLDNYDYHNEYFRAYRTMILEEWEEFQLGVKKLADRLKAPRFSIIIPAHNAEEHGLATFQSVKSQTFKDYECIVVCDGCSDLTEDVAKAFGFKTIRTEYHNDGLARSRGLDEASGQWVLFLDDDDWWMHEYVLEMLDHKLNKLSCDVLCFSFIFKHRGYAHPFGNAGNLWPAVWNKCWRREFIGETRFPNVYSISDAYFHKEMMGKNPMMAIWDMPFYYYNYLRPGSISELSRKGENNGNQGES